MIEVSAGSPSTQGCAMDFPPGLPVFNLIGIEMKKALFALWTAVLALFAAPAFAVLDITAATTGISDAQVAVLAVLAAMIVMAAAVYGVRKVLRLLGGR